MKKLLSIINIIFINIILFIVLDYSLFNYLDSKLNKNNFKQNIQKYITYTKLIYFDEDYREKEENNFFRDCIKDTDKKPILVFGCSFGYGWLLTPEQAFSHKLSNLSNRSVYNRSIPSLGIQNFPYILKHYSLEKSIKDPEYIIYIMIDNHLYRMYREIMAATEPYINVLYKTRNNSLEERRIPYDFIFKSTIARYINEKSVFYFFNKKSNEETFDFMKLHFLEAKQIVKSKFPNSKIVILHYEENPNSWIFNTSRWTELEEEGFIILNSFELTNKHLYEKEYRIDNDIHPNEKAWDIVVPTIIKELNL